MEKKLRDAFERVDANDALIERTWQNVQAQMYHASRPFALRRWLPVMIAAVCLLMVVGIGGHRLYFTSTAVVSIDVNPSIEMDVNRFDKVIALNAYNEDGQTLVKTLDIVNLDVEDALDEVLANDTISELVAKDADLSIAVAATEKNTAQGEAILAYANQCTARHTNTHCVMVDGSNMDEAHELGLSCGKYDAYQALRAVDPNITPEAVQQMTMREIRERLAAAGASVKTSEQGHRNGQANERGRGNGQGMHGGHHGRHMDE